MTCQYCADAAEFRVTGIPLCRQHMTKLGPVLDILSGQDLNGYRVETEDVPVHNRHLFEAGLEERKRSRPTRLLEEQPDGSTREWPRVPLARAAEGD